MIIDARPRRVLRKATVLIINSFIDWKEVFVVASSSFSVAVITFVALPLTK